MLCTLATLERDLEWGLLSEGVARRLAPDRAELMAALKDSRAAYAAALARLDRGHQLPIPMDLEPMHRLEQLCRGRATP
jgi:hypothetical protein